MSCQLTLSLWCAIVWFFLFKHKTAYEMRISDWSSDVCSSDLIGCAGSGAPLGSRLHPHPVLPAQFHRDEGQHDLRIAVERKEEGVGQPTAEDRKSAVSGKGVSVRVDLGGARCLKTKTH